MLALIVIIAVCSVCDASLIITDVDTDLTDVKENLAKVEKKLADMETQMSKVKGRLENLETEEPTTPVPTSKTACKDGWVSWKGSCYLFGATNVAFAVAKEYCVLQGAHLVHVDNQEENTFLKDFMVNYGDQKVHYWIGITDIEREGVWKLTETGTAPFFDWHTTEPKGGTSENCVRFASEHQYRWRDIPCTSVARYLCEQN